jgi:hypothetical protein
MATLSERLANQKQKTELAELQLKERLAKKASKGITQKYDATDRAYATQRKSLVREVKPEDDIQSLVEKGQAVAVGRDLERNNAPYKGIQKQRKVNIVGSGPKAQFKTVDEDWNKEASDWFNGDWAKWCDGRDDQHWSELLANAVTAEGREGDQLWVFDDFDRQDGTLTIFEADQIVSIEDGDWLNETKKQSFPWKEQDPTDRRRKIPLMQKNGIVYDSRGRVHAYVVTHKVGKPICRYDEVSIIPRWSRRHNPAGSAVLYKQPWRANQYRGAGTALTVANQQRDIYEMVAAELQSAKRSAQDYAFIEVDKDAEGAIIRALQRVQQNNGSVSPTDVNNILYGDGSAGSGFLGAMYENLEGNFGGRMDYLNPGERAVIHDNDRPSPGIKDFSSWIQEATGFAHGLGRCTSTGRAESSYTAFRGENLLSWATIYVEQKAVERRLCDFCVFKAINFAVRRGEISMAPDNWYKKVVFEFPKMPEVDELKAAMAQRMYMKNGAVDFSAILGPDWREKFTSYSEQVEFARALGLPLAIFETVSGSLISENLDEQN